MQNKEVINWYVETLSSKKIKIQSLKDLKSGSLLLQAIHIYFPKYVDLTKIYIKPKNSFQVLQNYKQISNIFTQLGWKKIDPQRYVKQQDKDILDISNMIIKKLNIEKKNKMKTLSFSQIQLNDRSCAGSSFMEDDVDMRINQLTSKKQRLLGKISAIQHVLNQATESKNARNLITKILQQ